MSLQLRTPAPGSLLFDACVNPLSPSPIAQARNFNYLVFKSGGGAAVRKVVPTTVKLPDLRKILPIWHNSRSLFGQFYLSGAGQHRIEGKFRFPLSGQFGRTGLYYHSPPSRTPPSVRTPGHSSVVSAWIFVIYFSNGRYLPLLQEYVRTSNYFATKLIVQSEHVALRSMN